MVREGSSASRMSLTFASSKSVRNALADDLMF